MPAATKPFAIFCGPDDFIVNRLGKERFEALAAEANADDFSREVISGFANNVDEVETAVNRFRDAVQTVPMFGGKRVVWFKDVNFLADSVTGRAEGTLKQVEALQELLEKVNADEVASLTGFPNVRLKIAETANKTVTAVGFVILSDPRHCGAAPVGAIA